MTKYLMRLDDACEKRNIENWDRMEALLDKYNVTPLVAVIPNCKDPDFEKYDIDENFWNDKIKTWLNKGWQIALHGYEHTFHKCDNKLNLNPINNFSEFVGLDLKEQREKIAKGILIFKKYWLEPEIFVAPAHSFDKNTLIALREETNIRIISDTIAFDPYFKDGFYFVPQQAGIVRKLPFATVTFCYHPNEMREIDFKLLDEFLQKNHKKFVDINKCLKNRKLNLLDFILKYIYFSRKLLIKLIRG